MKPLNEATNNDNDDSELHASELNDWRSDWIAQPAVRDDNPSDVRASAVRQQRRLRTRHVAELVAAVVLVTFSAAVLWRNPTLEAFMWAGTVWATTLAATAFSLWNWNILWKANLKSVNEYALDYRKRWLASLRAVRFGTILLGVQTAIALPWLTYDYFRRHLSGGAFAGSVAILACLVAGFWLLFRHYRRVALQELQELDASELTSAD
jgi:hypothetical protein